MASQSEDAATRWADFRSRYNHYPRSILRTDLLDHTLDSFQIDLETEDMFAGASRFMFLHDLIEDGNEFHSTAGMKDIEDVKARMDPATKDPWWRFVFINSQTSRGCLGCTKEELSLVLTHHQVMPALLEFVSTFRDREKPLLHAMFRHENFLLDAYDTPLELPNLGRSGVQLQHAFNLFAIEKATDPRMSDKWPVRHTTLYHSFDLKSGRCMWMLLKGNKLLHKRIQKATASTSILRPDAIRTKEQSFLGTLRIHAIMLEWCAENLSEYIDAKEKEIRALAMDGKVASVDRMTDPKLLAARHSRRPTLQTISRRRNTISTINQRQSSNVASDAMTPAPPSTGDTRRTPISPVREAFSFVRRVSGLSHRPSSLTGREKTPIVEEPLEMVHPELGATFPFKRRQKLSFAADELEQAILMIDQNNDLIDQIIEQYELVAKSEAFKTYLTTKICGHGLSAFYRKARTVSRTLEMHRRRLTVLARAVENDKQMFECLSQYASMRTSKAFSIIAKNSTKEMMTWTLKMHDIAVKTKLQALSMHVITVFTLIFLPGTFLATFFSSGAFRWDDDGKLGKAWAARDGVIGLFMAICLPMMAIVIVVWAVLVWHQRRQEKRQYTDLGGYADERGIVPPANDMDSDETSGDENNTTGLGIGVM